MSAKEPARSISKQSPAAGQKKLRQRRDSGKDARDPGVQILREFANSNSTMHAFIGGRQKSWMTSGVDPTASARPSGSLNFPKKTNASPTKAAISQSPSKLGGTLLQRWVAPTSVPPISTSSTQPQGTAGGTSQEENVLPSPAPSDDVVSPVMPAAKEMQTIESADENHERLESVEVPSTERNVEAINSAPAMEGREESHTEDSSSLETGVIQVDGNNDSGGGQDTAQPTNRPVTPSNQTSLRIQPGPAPNKRRRIEVSAQGHAVNESHPTKPTPSTPALAMPAIPLARPTITRSTAPSLTSWLSAITVHVSQSGGVQALGTVDRYRINLLEQACKIEDSIYLALHQLFCLETLRPGTMISIDGFGPQQKSALQIVSMLLYPNEHLSRPRLEWFSTFPCPLQHLLRVSTLYQGAVIEVRLFLTVLMTEMRKLESLCIQRDYPPLTYELVNNLQLKSRTFQRVVFRAIHQSMWKTHDGWFEMVEETYRQEQHEYYEVISRINTARPCPIPQVQERIRQIVLRYQHLRREQVQAQARSRVPSNLASPTNVQTTTHQTASMPVRPQTVTSQPPSCGTFFTTFHAGPPTLRSNHPIQQAPPQLQINIPPPSRFASWTSSPSALTSNWPVATSSHHQHHQLTPAHSPPNMGPPTQISPGNQPQLGQSFQFSVHQPNPRGLPSEMYGPSRAGAGLRTVLPASPYTVSSSTVAQSPVVPAVPSQQTPTLTRHGTVITSQQQFRQGQPGNLVFSEPALSAELERLLMPSTPFSLSNVHPNPTITALHQVHLRSPRLVPVDQNGKELKTTRFYRYFKKFAQPPFLLATDSRTARRSFLLSKEAFVKLPQAYSWPSYEYLSAGSVREGSLTYRIRCCILDTGNDSCDESRWSLKELVWPEHVFFDLNGQILDVRRKYHHGKDLAVEVSAIVKEGINTLTVVILRPNHAKSIPYAFAVEAVELTTHDTVMQNCTRTSPIPAEQTLKQIITSLATDPMDDELAIVHGQVTISVTDPFTSQIFNIPVRSISCLHRDCFDLDTFLQTRKTSAETPTESLQLISKVDDWRCPLCGADARPQMLRVDEFMLRVRARLEQLDQLDTKSIVVMQDGTWRANLPSQERKRTIPSSSTGPTSTVNEGTPDKGLLRQASPSAIDLGKNERVVIELDD